jgi:hypothetical protein
MTEWLGGTILIRDHQAFHTPQVLSPNCQLSTVNCQLL